MVNFGRAFISFNGQFYSSSNTNWIYATMSNTKPDKPNNTAKPSRQDYQALERQNRALLKELEIRKKEIEFLKKASAYFASLK